MPMTRETIVDYLVRHHGVAMDDLADESPLFSTGLLDSFAMIDLIVGMEKGAGFRMAASEVNLDNIDSIARILRYVESKQVALSQAR